MLLLLFLKGRKEGKGRDGVRKGERREGRDGGRKERRKEECFERWINVSRLNTGAVSAK